MAQLAGLIFFPSISPVRGRKRTASIVPYLVRHNVPFPLTLLCMSSTLQFDPKTFKLTGPVGTLPISATDQMAQDFLMLVEGQCLENNIAAVTSKYGYCRQRY